MKKKYLLCLLLLSGTSVLKAQSLQWAQKMANTAMNLWSDTASNSRWTYEQGVVWQGMKSVWMQSGDARYIKYVQRSADRCINADGTIRTYKAEDYNIDNVMSGRSLLTLYRVLGAEKYYKAATTLREQLKTQPRIPQGGFWHKKRYPNQMWLDGLYMGEPFYAEYASTFHETADFDDIANQFVLMETAARDAKTGLLYHGWDQSKKERWANPQTGLSPHFWGRAIGWYGMALVDVLDYFPANHPKRPQLISILNRLVVAMQKYQDAKSGVWYQIVDKAGAKGNYLEASASCMFVYTLAKAAREGHIPKKYIQVAQTGYSGIIKQFITTDANGQVNLNGVCSVAGLGGNPYRDGSYEYYISEKVTTNDMKGVGAFMMASVEVDRLAHLSDAKGKTVLLDSYFNNERKKDVTGAVLPYHYKWEGMDNNGFSLLGYLFNNYGVQTQTLYDAPTAANLKKANIYLIVDPDIPKENPDAKYIEQPHIKAVSDWVQEGGVLLVLNNDTGNAEFKHLNELMAKFGIYYNENSVNHVVGSQFEQGAVTIPAGNEVFKTARKIYIKEISTFTLKAPAKAALNHQNQIVVATARYGKGAVLAVGDPWFYNEYLDGRKLPAEMENYKAANDVIAWLIKQIPAKR
ncbi:glycoside hydrolase family 88 protein [Mucilaginibacter lacusdianchii]|uniref:glycoside hydrolase family 88 protein n=1 Tax=Mucilaginibacter lacusdianchii TaxID=2684211 RepID=UPI00131A7E89|nr:glycoside hydrolase family 88 protein [Mucilaginibacter sp. JXJ CY 39]